MTNRYKYILNKDKNIGKTSGKIEESCTDSFSCLAANTIAPVLTMYVHWILTEAKCRNIRRLYFFARDGYLLYYIALILCKKMELDIECSYFYCSRYSLRMAAYRFFDSSAYEKLFIHAYKLSPRNMLKRAGFSKQERFNVYKEMTCVPFNERNIMGKAEFNDFCSRVKKTSYFKNLLQAKSDNAYKNMIAYIKQEGMQNHDRIGIVDFGWTGSMQSTLHKIFESCNIKTKLTGFYIGMFEKVAFQKNSEYLTWLFEEKNAYIRAWFSQNLLECMCTAPHGMTMGYYNENNNIKPVLSECENNSSNTERLKAVVREFAKEYKIASVKNHRKIAKKILKQLMFNPTKSEIELLKEYAFCDDVGEQYHATLVQNEESKQFRRQLLFYKLINRDIPDVFYWYYGSLKVSKLLIKGFYKYAYFFTKYITVRIKQRVS